MLKFVKKKMLLFGVVLLIGCASIERIPYSNRVHLVLSSDMLERYIGMYVVKKEKSKYEEGQSIMNENSPEAIRVQNIMNRLLLAMHIGLGLKHGFAICENGPVFIGSGLIKGKKPVGLRLKVKNWIADKFCLKYGTKHLEGLKWDVILLNTTIDNASYFPTGHIFVHRMIIEGCSDTEIATILAHEIGHGVARHQGERLVRLLWSISTVYLLAYKFWMLWFFVSTQRYKETNMLIKIELSFFRRDELETDYIGLMLMASAGYDPRVVPGIYEKFNNDLEESSSTHPSGRKRAKMLSSEKVMSKAVAIYKQVQAGKGVTRFI